MERGREVGRGVMEGEWERERREIVREERDEEEMKDNINLTRHTLIKHSPVSCPYSCGV
jgi:hypothetical protein